MKNCIKVISLAIVLFILAGCVSQRQDHELNNEGSRNGLGTELSALRPVDGSKVATTTPVENISAKKDKDEEKKALEGLTICIDPGHGKITKSINKEEPIAPGSKIMKAATASGTSGVYTNISEESLNLIVSKKLKNALLAQGAKIIMVRETSECNLTNVDRTKLWNSSGADLTIRIHANGINDSKVSGVLMMIPGGKYIKDEEILKKSAQA
ncbi:MAG: N-acetylmuramoyl-L-alanine amidase, partial [Ruminiclostridium sp.]